MNLTISTAAVKELGSNEAIFLAFLKSKDTGGFFEIAYLEIESKLGFSKKTVLDLSEKLAELNIIEVQKAGKKYYFKIQK